MVDEIMAYVQAYRNDYGRSPSQQELDDFMYSWRKNRNANGEG